MKRAALRFMTTFFAVGTPSALIVDGRKGWVLFVAVGVLGTLALIGLECTIDAGWPPPKDKRPPE